MSEPQRRVVVADDHYLVREGVRQLVELEDDLCVVDTVGSAGELLASVRRWTPDVVITDIRMPPGNHTDGIQAALTVRRELPGTGVVVLSAHAEPEYALELFAAGTDGLAYLLKDRVGDRTELTRAVRATAAGGSVIDPLVVEAMVRQSRRQATISGLTAREQEVLHQMAEGRSNPAIGAALFLSVSAVEKHITSIFSKLGLSEETSTHRRVAAVLAYLGAG